MRRVYCIYDIISEIFVGSLVIERADAPVIRAFFDVLANKETTPGQHPADFILKFLGHVTDSGELLPGEITTIATGASWAASQDNS